MKCPIDNATLLMSDKNGIEIDYCPECRGVWLDRGELDKLIEKSAAVSQQYNEPKTDYRPPRNNEYGTYSHEKHQKKHRKESFLGDLFDF